MQREGEATLAARLGRSLSGTQLERELKRHEYSVSNRGLRPNLVGTPEYVRERVAEFEGAGLDLLLERFAAQVMLENFAAS
jgi:FMNH2-dependent dimethyl sulfone monooxygenase